MKFKKILSAVCSVAMAAGMFTGCLTAKAAGEKVVLEYVAEESTPGEVAVIKLKTVGITPEIITNYAINLTMPTGWKENIEYTAVYEDYTGLPNGKGSGAIASQYKCGYYGGQSDAIPAPGDGVFGKVTITFKDKLTEPLEIPLLKNTKIVGYNGGTKVTYAASGSGVTVTTLEGTTIPAASTETTVTAANLADAVTNDGDIYKYTPFKAAIDFDKQTIKGAKIEINGVETAVDTTKFSNIPTDIKGSATVGIIVKSLASQTVGAVKLIIE